MQVYGMNATLIATRRGYLDLLKYLLAFAETSTHAAASSLGISCENGSGWGVLHYAANGAWLDIVKYLIEERYVAFLFFFLFFAALNTVNRRLASLFFCL
jgi:ankyrin repeat protein